MNALITGSTKGIGKNLGINLLYKDYFVYFNGHTQESTKLLEQKLYNEKLNNCNIICEDLSTLEGNLELANYIKAQDIYLDVLVLNLGITNRTPYSELSYNEWKEVMDVNLNFPFFLIQALENHINDNGRIIFISSISGIIPDSISIPYGVSKAGINMLVPYLAKESEFVDRKITVNAIAPGYISTSWHQNKSNEQMERIANKCLANRFGMPIEVSSVVMMIIDNSFVNGQVIRVDGGFGLK